MANTIERKVIFLEKLKALSPEEKVKLFDATTDHLGTAYGLAHEKSSETALAGAGQTLLIKIMVALGLDN